MAYEMRISDCSSDVCSSDLEEEGRAGVDREQGVPTVGRRVLEADPAGIARVVDQNVEGSASVPLGERVVESLEQGRDGRRVNEVRVDRERRASSFLDGRDRLVCAGFAGVVGQRDRRSIRSEEHTSEIPSLMRISYPVFSLKKKN